MQAEDVRHIENPFLKIVNIIKPDQDQLFNMLFNLIQEFFNGVKLPTLEAIASDPEQTEVDISVYAGANGYLYMLIRLYRFFMVEQMKTKENEEKMRSRIQAEDGQSIKFRDPQFYINLALQQYHYIREFIEKPKKKSTTLSFYMSETCTWLCGMHIGYILRDNHLFRYNENKLIECFNLYKEHKGKMQVELLYGIPGFLYTLLEAQQYYDGVEELFRTNFKEATKAITVDIINFGIADYEQATKKKIDVRGELPNDFRLRYTFHKKEYLGGAHGLGGNLNIILMSLKMNNFDLERVNIFINLISASIRFLLKHFINRNFTTSVGSTRTKLVHMCHGNPGIVSCLARFQLMFPELGIQMGLSEIITASLDHIWKFGILKKGFGLCHGISGNAYSFIYPAILELYPDSAEELKRKATLFALLREEKEVMKEIKGYEFKDRFKKGISDNPYSLMLGIAGDICFTADVILGEAKFPGFDF